MTSAGLSHSDQHRFAFPGETDSHQMHPVVAAVDPSAQNLLELLSLQGFERLVAALGFKSFLRRAVEPAQGAGAIVVAHRAEEGGHHVLRTGRRSLRTAKAQRSNQEAAREGESQVPEQDGAKSSSSAAETNSSLHQNDAREWPLRTH